MFQNMLSLTQMYALAITSELPKWIQGFLEDVMERLPESERLTAMAYLQKFMSGGKFNLGLTCLAIILGIVTYLLWQAFIKTGNTDILWVSILCTILTLLGVVVGFGLMPDPFG